MAGEVLTCVCPPFENRYCEHRSDEMADYLRRLADRVDQGVIRHISVSVHPVDAAIGGIGDDDE